ncbi:MAG: response regulator, partial [Candidatus Margulisiibacteriota bacterium]
MTKLTRLVLILFGLSFFVFSVHLSAQINPTVNSRTYLPGDFVHVIVEAPVDTSQITAVMPDGTVTNLIQERGRNIWRGIWQVPINFPKGTYSAKLSAVDVSGNVFEGMTDVFTIGELAMITLVGKPSPEAQPKQPLSEKIQPTTITPGPGEAEIIKRVLRIISVPTTAPAPPLKALEKTSLVEKNLALGKDFFDKEKYLESAAYFRIVLYISPENKDAALYLAQATDLLARQDAENKQRMIMGFVFSIAGLILLALFLWFLRALYINSKKAAVCPVEPAKPLSQKEKSELWLKKMNWTSNPFSIDILGQLFTNDHQLEFEAFKLFIRAQIEKVGGASVYPFTDTALEKIFSLSKGKPKTAVKIIEWAINKAIERNVDQISAEFIKEYEGTTNKNILIADDEEIVRSSLAAILKNGGGYQTDFAHDGDEALKKIKENVYGLVLLDIAMPKIDGYEILKQVREIYPELPIIFVTGKGSPQQTLQSMS